MTDENEYPQGAVLACMRVADSWVIFEDNIRRPCAQCGEEIHHRPYVPEHVTKLCIQCVMARTLADEKAGKPVTITTTKRAIDEARLFYSKDGRKQ